MHDLQLVRGVQGGYGLICQQQWCIHGKGPGQQRPGALAAA